MSGERFDRDYYQRFYHDATTRAVSPQEQALQTTFIAAYLRYLQVPVRTILDVGCGLGDMLAGLQHAFPDACCTGVEVSEYLCKTHGWEHGSVVDLRRDPCDLVVCHDVLGYLNKKDCRKAIRNLSRLTAHALYLSVVTAEDEPVYDPEHTDMTQKFRPVAFYRELLARDFVTAGGGFYLKKPLTVPVWQLEMLE